LINKGGPDGKPDLLHVILTVLNGSGATITNVTPLNPLDVQGGQFSVAQFPANQGILTDGHHANFEWQLLSSANLTVHASAVATGPGGQVVQIGPVTCE
jgi:hypothetical protein